MSKIKLLDTFGRESWVDLPDDTKEVAGVVVSGDMVLVYPFFFDAGRGVRLHDYLDASWIFPVEKLDEVNTQKTVHDVLDLLPEYK